jgi:hypothetical protein
MIRLEKVFFLFSTIYNLLVVRLAPYLTGNHKLTGGASGYIMDV